MKKIETVTLIGNDIDGYELHKGESCKSIKEFIDLRDDLSVYDDGASHCLYMCKNKEVQDIILNDENHDQKLIIFAQAILEDLAITNLGNQKNIKEEEAMELFLEDSDAYREYLRLNHNNDSTIPYMYSQKK